MKTLSEKQMKVVRMYASTLNMKAQSQRFGWTKEQAINKVKEYVCSGSPLTINEYFASQAENSKSTDTSLNTNTYLMSQTKQ